MMNLADQREPSAGQALGEMKFPQRVGAIQRRGGHLTDDPVELPPAARRGDLYPPQVVIQVDLAVFLPHRMMQLPRDVDELVAQRFQQMQPAAHVVPEHLETELAVEVGRVDDRHLQRVRVQVRRLAVEQHGVHTVESFHAPPAFCSIVR